LANFGFIIDNRRCIGCHACTVACKAEHDVPVGVNRTWVKYIETGEFPESQRHFSVMRCNHCDNAPCIEICPVTALYRRSDGIVDFDNRRCIGCKACMQACPYDALYIDPQTHTAAKCNYCAHRIDVGLEPACVNVCPTQAIISGDLDDPESRISQLLREQPVTARKTEMGTLPALYYIDGRSESLEPMAADPIQKSLWGQQNSGVGHFSPDSTRETEHALEKLGRMLSFGESSETLEHHEGRVKQLVETFAQHPRRAYDAPQKGVLWGWQVSGYLWTKSIATGVIIATMMAKAYSVQLVTESVEWFATMIALVFLGITGGLLVWDLDKPLRFLYVLLRPQWRSWLVRGAYLITGYAIGLTLNLLMLIFAAESGLHRLLPLPLIALALLAAVYTAFLFAQAKGRTFWKSRTVPLNMVTHAVLCGSAMLMLFHFFWPEDFVAFTRYLLMVTALIHIAVTMIEIVLPHEDHESRAVMNSIVKGRYRRLFWGASLFVGTLLPLLLLVFFPSTMLLPASLLILFGVFAAQHVWVRAPQQIPLS